MIAAAMALPAASAAVSDLRHDRRVLIVAAPAAADPRVATQRAILARWAAGAAERDITTVEVIGDRVTGAGDHASTLRDIYRIAPSAFTVVLIGKDGHVAMRTTTPVAVRRLQDTIDAMPMRRAGQR